MALPDDCPVCRRTLTPGQVLRGWSPCTCSAAWGENKGHRTLQCLPCLDEHVETVRYSPPCQHLGGHPNRR